MIKIKRIITALLNNRVNIELTKEENIQVIEKDLLYQDAVIETIESNENIDYLLLNENLPGENLNEFINKIEKLQPIKIILFVDKIKKEQNQFQTQIYKIYENNWKVDTTKIDIVLNNIKNPKDIEIIPYERKEAKMQERKIKIYKKILKIKGE